MDTISVIIEHIKSLIDYIKKNKMLSLLAFLTPFLVYYHLKNEAELEKDTGRFERMVREDEIEIKVEEVNETGRDIELFGKQKNGRPKFVVIGKIGWKPCAPEVSPGDSVIKRLGEITLELVKKDTIIIYEFSYP